jgi:hypothetical protein
MPKLKKYFPPIVIGLLSSVLVVGAALTIGGTSVTSDGALSITAGGTDQNITLTPSGTGSVVTTANLAVGTTTATYLFTVATGSAIFSINSVGNIGLSAAPSSDTLLYINKDWGHPSGNRFGIYIDHGVTLTSAASRSVYGISADAYSDGNFNNTGDIIGGIFTAYGFQYGTGISSNLYGILAEAFQDSGTGGATNQYGAHITTYSYGTAQSNVYSVYAHRKYGFGGTTTNAYGVYITNPTISSGGTLVNNYGLYLANQTDGTTLNYSIYSAGGTNYLAGDTGIGTAFPSSTLHIQTTSSTIQIGNSGNSGCIKLGSASGTAAIVYVWFDSNAAMYSSTTKPVFCQ